MPTRCIHKPFGCKFAPGICRDAGYCVDDGQHYKVLSSLRHPVGIKTIKKGPIPLLQGCHMPPPGDKGQRYQVEAFGYPLDEKWNVIGWSTNLDGAEQMRDAILLAPSCSQARIIDRNAPLEGSPDRHLRQC